MNIAEAKSIPIADLLQKAGHQPAKEQGGRKWYIRPYGEENHASFVLSKDGHAWFDHGTGEGGNIIDLAMRLGDCRDVSGALDYIQSVTGQTGYTIPTIRQRLPVTPQPPAYIVEADRPLSDTRGIQWCNSRGLDPAAVQPYLRDVYFNREAKPVKRSYYGIALPNLSGGFEARSKFDGQPWSKVSIGAKDMTAFNLNPDAAWITFEGMPDFCTFLTLDKPPAGTFNYLILNGTAMTGKAIEYLSGQPPTALIICSQAGKGAQQSKDALMQWSADQGWSGGDIDHKWEGFEDYNARLMHDKGMLKPSVQAAVRPGLKTTPKFGM